RRREGGTTCPGHLDEAEQEDPRDQRSLGTTGGSPRAGRHREAFDPRETRFSLPARNAPKGLRCLYSSGGMGSRCRYTPAMTGGSFDHERWSRERSYWLREALADDPGEPCPPLSGDTEADVLVVGGGYTGMWTAHFLKECQPDVDVVLLEQDICGGG